MLNPTITGVYKYNDLSGGRPYEEDQVWHAVCQAFSLHQHAQKGSVLGKYALLHTIIHPGDKVLLKPNLVKECHLHKPDEWDSIITHPFVIKAVLRLVLDALQGDGQIIIADAPQTDSKFACIAEVSGLREMVEKINKEQSVPITLLDLRQEEWDERSGVTVAVRQLAGDPLGYTRVKLNELSEFVGHGHKCYYGASYDIEETNAHHHDLVHEYMVAATALDCDVFINMPKLKTHKKAGVTLNLKNLVGINGNKNWLPHHSEGSIEAGGDQFPDSSIKNYTEQRLMSLCKKIVHGIPWLANLLAPARKLGQTIFGDTEEVVRSGNWHGNDTVWRMVLDLNKAMFYFNPDGSRRSERRRFLSIVDGIVTGEGNGPMAPDRRVDGLIAVGCDPVVVDCTLAKLMGFDYQRIPQLDRAFIVKQLPLTDVRYEDIVVRSNVSAWNRPLYDIAPSDTLRMKPHFGWQGHIELSV